MPYYTGAHRFYQYNTPASGAALRTKIRDEMVAAGWSIVSEITDDTTLEVVPTPEGNGDLQVRLWLGTESGYDVIRFQAGANVFWGVSDPLRMFVFPTARYYLHVSPHQAIVWTPYDGAWDGRYMAFGVFYTPPDFHVGESAYNGASLSDCGAWIANFQSDNLLTRGSWQYGHYVMNLETEANGRPRLDAGVGASEWWPDSGRSLTDPWWQTGAYGENPPGPGYGQYQMLGAWWDSMFLTGKYPSGEVFTFDERSWICPTHYSGNAVSLLLPMWSD